MRRRQVGYLPPSKNFSYESRPNLGLESFLDYYRIPYKVVEVNPMSKKKIKWSNYKKVPILTVDGEQMVDSSEIVSKLFKKIHPEGSNVEVEEETKWQKLLLFFFFLFFPFFSVVQYQLIAVNMGRGFKDLFYDLD
ncbi:Prostaglandin E synthase 2 [Linum perenne]